MDKHKAYRKRQREKGLKIFQIVGLRQKDIDYFQKERDRTGLTNAEILRKLIMGR